MPTDILDSNARSGERGSGDRLAAPDVLGPTSSAGLHGRDDELKAACHALDLTVTGGGRVLLFAGEAGLGKTRLAMELAEVARSRGMAVLWGSCVAADLALPFLPFNEAIGNHLA